MCPRNRVNSTDWGDNPFPVLLAGAQIPGSLIWNRETLAEAKASFIEYYAKREMAPDNMPGPDFHRNLFDLLVYGDPSIQLR